MAVEFLHLLFSFVAAGAGVRRALNRLEPVFGGFARNGAFLHLFPLTLAGCSRWKSVFCPGGGTRMTPSPSSLLRIRSPALELVRFTLTNNGDIRENITMLQSHICTRYVGPRGKKVLFLFRGV